MGEAERRQRPIEAGAELLRYRSCLVDPLTDLPALPMVVDEVRRLLEETQQVEVFVVRFEQEGWLERVVGWDRYDSLLRRVADHLRTLLDRLRGEAVILCQNLVRGDTFILFSPPGPEAARLGERLGDPLALTGEQGDALSVDLQIGQGSLRRSPGQRVERCVYNGVLRAWNDLRRRGEALYEERRADLRRLLSTRAVRSVFQPIVSLPERQVIGYEALSRGPAGSYLEPADNLFAIAQRAGLLGEVESLCLEEALANARRLDGARTLFVNLSIRGLEAVAALEGGLAGLVERSGWSPRELVLEITERTYAENPVQLREMVASLREPGFRIAIDDMGTGYSSMHVLADLEPDFIKLDQLLVRDVDIEPIKRKLALAISSFATSSHAQVIAEGVERPGELAVLEELGISLAQGFHLGHPQPA